MTRRITIQWTDTAKEQLKGLPRKVQIGLLEKADELLDCDDPTDAYKPLKGPLRGLYSMPYSRYRALFTVEEEEIVNGDVLIHVTVRFVAVGTRKEHDRKDVYKVATKLVALGLLEIENVNRRKKG